MLTVEETNLAWLFELINDYSLHYLQSIGNLRVQAGAPAEGRLEEKIEKVTKKIRFCASKLKKWGEDAASEELLNVIGELSFPLTTEIEFIDKRRKLLRRALEVNNHIQQLSPLPVNLAQVPWKSGSEAESSWCTTDETTRRRSGYILILWCARTKSLPAPTLWRLVRRELAHVFALRLKPYYEGESPRDTVAVPLKAGDFQSRENIAQNAVLRPAVDVGKLRQGETPWANEFPAAENWHEAIGYFFIPGPSSNDPYGMDHRELLSLLMRLTWSLSALVPELKSPGDRLSFRTMTGRAEVEWQVGGPEGRDYTQGFTPPRVLDNWASIEVAPALFRDSTTKNCCIVDPGILENGTPHSSWFTSSLSRPLWHRKRRGDFPELFLCSSPAFNGRASWVERIEMVKCESLATIEGGSAGELRPISILKTGPSSGRQRRSSRIQPPRPLKCILTLGERDYSAFLMNFGPGGCCAAVPLRNKEDQENLIAKLHLAAQKPSGILTLLPGLAYPWGRLVDARGGKVEVGLPPLNINETDSRIRPLSPADSINFHGLSIRLVVGSVIQQES